MVHGINYPDETGRNQMEVRLWNPVMEKGIIGFLPPDECTNIRVLQEMESKAFDRSNTETVDVLWSQFEDGR